MSNVSSVSSAVTSAVTTATTTSSSSSYVSEESFLKLLVAELQNQDPLNPQDSTQFISQLASFSSLEQMTAMNTSLETVLETSATSLIGKTATVSSSSDSSGYITGTITGVVYYSNGTAVTIDGTDYLFSDVQNVGE